MHVSTQWSRVLTSHAALSVVDEIEWKMHVQNDERVALVRKGKGLDETTRRLISKHVRPNKVKRYE
jgi:hypothetical protein